mmetsp:Transcript_26635/g.48819  ORF Transcript_26635/g.48819 Transcript_26635/m.48819 type:complete len:244 (-) Transcript_26635:10-741(-)
MVVALHHWVINLAVAGLAIGADGQDVTTAAASTTRTGTAPPPTLTTTASANSSNSNASSSSNESGPSLWFKPVESGIVTEGNLSYAYGMNETLRHDCEDFSSCGVLLKQNLSRCEEIPNGYKLKFGQVRYICPCSCFFCQESSGTETCTPAQSTVPTRLNSSTTTGSFPVLLAIKDTDSDVESGGQGYCRTGTTCAVVVAAACVVLTLAGALCMFVPIILAKRRSANQPDVGPNPNPIMTVII